MSLNGRKTGRAGRWAGWVLLLFYGAGVWSTDSLTLQTSDDYLARMDVASWSFQQTDGDCLLKQEVPEFGAVLFRQRLAKPLELQLTTQNNLLGVQQIRISQQSPPWQIFVPEQVVEATIAPVKGQRGVYRVDNVGTVLEGMRQGQQLRLTLANPLTGSWVDVVLQPVRLEAPLADFMQCQLALAQKALPVPPKIVKKPAIHKKTRAKKKSGEAATVGIYSPYQKWLREHEATKHPLAVTRGRDKSGLPLHMSMMFAPGKPSISKALQDDMEAMVKEWEIRQGEGRSMSLMIEEEATAEVMNLIKQRLDAIHAYLIARGISPSRLHMKIDKVSTAAHIDTVNVTVGN